MAKQSEAPLLSRDVRMCGYDICGQAARLQRLLEEETRRADSLATQVHALLQEQAEHRKLQDDARRQRESQHRAQLVGGPGSGGGGGDVCRCIMSEKRCATQQRVNIRMDELADGGGLV